MGNTIRVNTVKILDWMVNAAYDGRRRISYWLVCNNCYESRHEWCEDIFPDYCENCGAKIEYGEHYLEKEYNLRGERISPDGLSPGESCRIVCENCTQQKAL
jgi:hypothetical protein